mmetsp:Transcript_59028/g.189838  ORF Transcript_59028/g.189838 Transcript_59028/m.189838 type:complete len:91 (+) Transcript_59028:283-555(+)
MGPEAFRERLASFEDLSRLPTWDSRDIARLDRVIEVEVPALINNAGGVSAPPTSVAEVDPLAAPARRSLLARLGIGGGGHGGCKRKRVDD